MLSGCATRTTPSGGPRDTTAPIVHTSFPANGSLRFRGNELRLIFNEYISLKNPNQQISFSPPLNFSPEFTLKGKELTILWKDTLKANTTYTISFGEAIRDYTEGNINDQLKIVFSTGSYLDSLALTGKVLDGRTGSPEKQFVVALYDYKQVKLDDSVAFKQMPSYYTFTNDEGEFRLENLRQDVFHIIGFEDRRGNFRLNSGAEKIGFMTDSLALTDSTGSLTIETFPPKAEDRYYGAKHVAYGQIELAFNYEPDSLQVFEPGLGEGNSPYLTWEEEKDTISYWFNQEKKDSIVLIVATNEGLIDTSTVYLRPFKKKPLEVFASKAEYSFSEPLRMKMDQPLSTMDPKKIWIYASKDSLHPDTAFLESSRIIQIIPKKRPAQLTCYFMEGAITTYDGSGNDSLSLPLKTLRKNELGNVVFSVETEYEGALILLIINDAGMPIRREPFTKKLRVEIKNLNPGVYQAELIVDKDGDGEWTTGNYLTRRPAEKVIKYQDQIEVRANWDLELLWEAELPKF